MEQEKRTDLSLEHKNIDPVSFFSDNADFVFMHKKTEKLASAIYIVTGLLSDSEPIKWTLRKKASELLSFIGSYTSLFSEGHGQFIQTLKLNTLEVVSFLEVSWRGGLISEMNYSILKQEFSSLLSVVLGFADSHKEFRKEHLSNDFFDVPRHASGDSKSYHNERPLVVFGNIQKTTDISIKDRDAIRDKGDFKRSNRQNTILNLLKKKESLTIKDISAVVRDCSEKTIQRELISFISAGILKKTGERRWSRYFLA